MHAHHFFVGLIHVVFNARRGSDKVKAEFALQALFDDLHVQKAQESHAEAKAQRVAVLHLPLKRRVVQRQLLESLFKRLELVAFDGEQTRVYHGLRLAVARQGLGHAADPRGDSIAHANLGNVLQARDQISDFAHRKVRKRNLFGMARANFFNKNLGTGVHEAHLVALLDGAVDHANQRDHAAIRIEIRVENKRAQRAFGVAFGRRNKMHHGLEQVFHANARFATRQNRVIGDDRQAIFNLALHALGLGRGKVDLVDERNNLEVGVHGHHSVGDRLGLNALRGVHHEHRAFACRQASAHFIGEVDVTRGVDKVELVLLAIVGGIGDAHGLALDGNTALALDIHGIEQLLFHIALGYRAGKLENAVGKRRLAMVDMGDDAEIANELGIGAHIVAALLVSIAERAHFRGPFSVT